MAKQTLLGKWIQKMHHEMPSTVPAHVKKNPKKLNSMLAAIAHSKMRKGEKP